MSYSVYAFFELFVLNLAITANYHRLNGINNIHLFLKIMVTGMSKVKVPTDISIYLSLALSLSKINK